MEEKKEEIKEEQPKETGWEEYKEKVVIRKFDSDDVARLRGSTIMSGLEKGKDNVSIDVGMMQKVSIVLGVSKCPWFTDVIDDRVGVTKEIYNRRMGLEYRRIPTDYVDLMVDIVRQNNKAVYTKKQKKK